MLGLSFSEYKNFDFRRFQICNYFFHILISSDTLVHQNHPKMAFFGCFDGLQLWIQFELVSRPISQVFYHLSCSVVLFPDLRYSETNQNLIIYIIRLQTSQIYIIYISRGIFFNVLTSQRKHYSCEIHCFKNCCTFPFIKSAKIFAVIIQRMLNNDSGLHQIKLRNMVTIKK